MSKCLCCGHVVRPIDDQSIVQCKQCTHYQAIEYIKTEYDEYGNTDDPLLEYFTWLSNHVLKKQENPSVIDIGCNSGLLLHLFNKHGCETLGVEPSKALKPMWESRGIKVLDVYWNWDFSKEIEKFDTVLAIDVLNYVHSPFDFIVACKEVLTDKGSVYIQVPENSRLRVGNYTLGNGQVSYFTAKSFEKLTFCAGLYIHSARKVPIHGNSFLFELKSIPCRRIPEMSRFLEEELPAGR